ncbi:hypothetical protein PFISCL1PPCAC_14849 [Pristionchus fissidentatus]|uniref:G protein-coupled receptor n=1 Tax=Pristionchus fissidentatus TaxID=1538716 RepID=A0AAV5VXX2_9BILA|nr:hypothetical protein PFISCL1PPCAC_14849 [Pristionchus fissidentatus]
MVKFSVIFDTLSNRNLLSDLAPVRFNLKIQCGPIFFCHKRLDKPNYLKCRIVLGHRSIVANMQLRSYLTLLLYWNYLVKFSLSNFAAPCRWAWPAKVSAEIIFFFLLLLFYLLLSSSPISIKRRQQSMRRPRHRIDRGRRRYVAVRMFLPGDIYSFNSGLLIFSQC